MTLKKLVDTLTTTHDTRLLLYFASSAQFDRDACARYYQLGRRRGKRVDWRRVREAFGRRFGKDWVRSQERRKLR